MIRPQKGILTMLFALALAGALVTAFAIRTQAAAEVKEGEAAKVTHLFGNHKCPQSDEAVDPKSFVEYKDEANHVFGRLYTCCDGCNKKTEAKVAELYKKYFLTDAKTGKEKEALDLANKECPISGKPVDPSTQIEYNGMKLAFCCEKCPAAFLKDPDTSLAKLVPEEVAKEYKYEFKGSHSAK